MDKGLDEIIADKRSSGPRNNNRRTGGDRRRDRRDTRDGPRDGVRKSYRNEPRSIDSEWVHDRFEDDDRRRAPVPRRRRESPQPNGEAKGTKIKVENLHYDLTEEDLSELFRRIGHVVRLQMKFDRAGRSEGIAFITYENRDDADEAVKQFDGANANGRLTLSKFFNRPANICRTTYSSFHTTESQPIRQRRHAWPPALRAHLSPGWIHR
ncbi:hypothetical protein NQ176_g7059 [Zarea fungicola]|uniref:Uncharacterized protein n=1 Tax=Zarea fungicola TaxID=93591 RepID=A0ACC1N1F6_9HYPO|nr:hypothetical protein NQ176_g7059 [Lecanicillium fungicola]